MSGFDLIQLLKPQKSSFKWMNLGYFQFFSILQFKYQERSHLLYNNTNAYIMYIYKPNRYFL